MKQLVGGLCALSLALVCAGCENDSSGLNVGPRDISANPGELAFGLQHTDTTATQIVTLKNTGGDDLHVFDLSISPDIELYRIAGTSPAVAAPFTLASGDTVDVEIRFQPTQPGGDAMALVVESDDPDEGVFEVPLGGTGFLEQTDVIEQGTQYSADILFVVDDSGSMGNDQTKLANSFSTFINWLIDHTISFHIGVTTTDMSASGNQGTFFGSPAILKNDTPNLVTEFAANVHVGTSGSASEKGLDGAVAALTYPNITNENAGFLRDDAKLFVVIVSDEEDQSTESVSYYVDLLAAVKDGITEDLFLAAIVGPPTGSCSGDGTASAAPRYNEALALTGGLYGSICDSDFGLTLQNLAFEITSPTAEFFLSFIPDLETLKVKVDGVQQGADRWTYDPFANSVIFDAAFVPVMGADVSIEYAAIDTP